MTQDPPRDPMAALNEVLSEVIDVVMALRHAHRRVPERHELHAELDQLFSDAKSWAELLMEADIARGVSALAYMPSVAGRQPPNLWHGPVQDDDVRRVVVEQLDRLPRHVGGGWAGPAGDPGGEPPRQDKARMRAATACSPWGRRQWLRSARSPSRARPHHGRSTFTPRTRTARRTRSSKPAGRPRPSRSTCSPRVGWPSSLIPLVRSSRSGSQARPLAWTR